MKQEEREMKKREIEEMGLAKRFGKAVGETKRSVGDAVDEVTNPITKRWRDFKDGIAEGERGN